MRDLPRSFEHEPEIGGDIGRPCFKDRHTGHTVKGIVDLDGAETVGIIVEH